MKSKSWKIIKINMDLIKNFLFSNKELNLIDESKVLIMNEAKTSPFLTNLLENKNAKPKFFTHLKLSISKSRSLNLIEFSEVISKFLSTQFCDLTFNLLIKKRSFQICS